MKQLHLACQVVCIYCACVNAAVTPPQSGSTVTPPDIWQYRISCAGLCSYCKHFEAQHKHSYAVWHMTGGSAQERLCIINLASVMLITVSACFSLRWSYSSLHTWAPSSLMISVSVESTQQLLLCLLVCLVFLRVAVRERDVWVELQQIAHSVQLFDSAVPYTLLHYWLNFGQISSFRKRILLHLQPSGKSSRYELIVLFCNTSSVKVSFLCMAEDSRFYRGFSFCNKYHKDASSKRLWPAL